VGSTCYFVGRHPEVELVSDLFLTVLPPELGATLPPAYLATRCLLILAYACGRRAMARLVRTLGRESRINLGVVESFPFGAELDVSACRGFSDTLGLLEE
jgi:hypothetical protein